MNENIREQVPLEDLLSSAGLLCCSFLNASQIVPGKANPVSIGFALVDYNGRYVQVNDALAAINGLPVEAHPGKTIREVLGEAATKAEAVIAKVVATGECVVNQEICAVLPSRYEQGFWIAHFFPFKFKKDEPNYVAIMIVETTGLLKVGQCFASLMGFLPRIIDRFLLAGCPDPNSAEKSKNWNEALDALRQCRTALLRVGQYFPRRPELEDAETADFTDPFGTPFRPTTTPQIALNFASATTIEELSPRQIEVLKLIAMGKANKEIAEALRLSLKTVETYRSRLFDRLGVHSVADLVRFAIKNNLIEA